MAAKSVGCLHNWWRDQRHGSMGSMGTICWALWGSSESIWRNQSCERTINYHVSGSNAMNRWSFPFPVACWPNINLITWPIPFAEQLHAMLRAPCPVALLNVARQAYAMHLGANTLCTHTHTKTYRDRANCIREWPAKVCGKNNSNKMDALKTRANLEKLCPLFLVRILRTIFTVYTSNGKSGKKLYAIPRKEPVDALLEDANI